MRRFEGKVALVTGGRSGIGQAIAARLTDEGARVFTAQRGDDDRFEGIAADFTDPAAPAQVIAEVITRAGQLDVLVNNAGMMQEARVEEMTLDDWQKNLTVNLTAPFLRIQAAVPHLRKTKGSIVNTGSIEGLGANPNHAAYCATKGAVHALTRAMACDHGPEGIRVNAVCPGYIDTPMLQSFFNGDGSGGGGGNIETLQQADRDVHPMRTYGTPEDIANLVNWLASDEARYASGQLWVLDGGLSAQVQQMKL